MNTSTLVHDCGVHRNDSLVSGDRHSSFFATIVSDMMWLLQDKSPVVDQTTQPKQWTKQALQHSGTNRCIVRDTGCLMGIIPTVSLPPSWLSLFSYHIFVTLPMSHMVVLSILPMMMIRERPTKFIKILSIVPLVNKWLPQATTTTTMRRRATLGRGTIHYNEYGGDARPSGRNDGEHDHDRYDGFMGENRSMYLGATILMTFSSSFLMTTWISMRITWLR